MKKNLFKKFTTGVIVLLSIVMILSACSSPPSSQSRSQARNTSEKTPKYIFLFIGDGMGFPQMTAWANYRGTKEYNFTGTLEKPTPENLPKPVLPSFAKFPVVGAATTADASKFITDSASAATAIASGVKTLDGTIGLDPFGNNAPTIAELLKEKLGYKIGIITSVSLDHATPAGFYAHVPSRGQYYDIGVQLANSNFDFFGGGSFLTLKNGEKPVPEIAAENGFKVVSSKADTLALNSSSGRVLATSEALSAEQNLHFALDRPEGVLRLKDYVQKCIDVIQNDTGFFIMCEGGQIDWAEHLNDGYTALLEIGELELAVNVAIEFYNQHPDDTLILVTGDHETGGLANGSNATHYNTYYSVLENQKVSYYSVYGILEEWKAKKTSFEDAMKWVKQNYGLLLPNDPDGRTNPALVLSNYEINILQEAYRQSTIPPKQRNIDAAYSIAFSPILAYEPISLAITRCLNSRAGIGWTSTSHSGTPVAVYAMGNGQEMFNGMIDNTDICNNLKIIAKID